MLEKLSTYDSRVAYSESCQTSKLDRYAKIVNGYNPLTIFGNRSILDI